ncbi:epoxide hydrolase EphA [Aquimarina addita]|uniref:Epoxide hydrolase EphA n=1 Tax=Aquimarina addita TaxID=870485 RepID=A0ABP7XGG1_9FLAO
MKKLNFIAVAFIIILNMSCERDIEIVNIDNDDTSVSNGTTSSDGMELELTKKRDQPSLPLSHFDFETNTIMVSVGNDQFPVVDAGEGPVALLIHGWPDSKEMWRYQIPFLVNAGYRVIAPDLRGFGGAPKTQDIAAYGLGALMSDIITILDNMGIDNVNLVTHDWGAAIGWTMARYRPEYVNSFVTISIGATGNPGFDLMEQRRMNWYLYMFAQEGMGAYELSKNDWYLFRSIVFHPDEDTIIDNLSEPDALTTSMKPYQANFAETLLAACPGQTYNPGNVDIEYPLVTAPTLGLLGKYDFAMLQPQMIYSKDYVVAGNFKYKYFDDVGHWMMLEKPKRINTIIKNFLDCHALSDCN